MTRWLVAGLLALGCESAASNGPIDAGRADVGADTGRTLGQWQSRAAGEWRGEMAQSAGEMEDIIDRGSPNDFDAAGVEMLRGALREYGAAAVPPAPDASLDDRQAMTVRNTIDAIAPAYCRVAAAFRIAAPTRSLVRPAPRVMCSELPPTGAWWERWP